MWRRTVTAFEPGQRRTPLEPYLEYGESPPHDLKRADRRGHCRKESGAYLESELDSGLLRAGAEVYVGLVHRATGQGERCPHGHEEYEQPVSMSALQTHDQLIIYFLRLCKSYSAPEDSNRIPTFIATVGPAPSSRVDFARRILLPSHLPRASDRRLGVDEDGNEQRVFLGLGREAALSR